MDPKYAPHRCICCCVFENRKQFQEHLLECANAAEFFKEYRKLTTQYAKQIMDELK